MLWLWIALIVLVVGCGWVGTAYVHEPGPTAETPSTGLVRGSHEWYFEKGRVLDQRPSSYPSGDHAFLKMHRPGIPTHNSLAYQWEQSPAAPYALI